MTTPDHSVGTARPTTLLYLMKQIELAVRAELDDLTRPENLTALQYTALTVLERHDGLTSAHLARNSFVTAQSMADMIAALEGRGLIERHRDARDRRRLLIDLTQDGRAVLDRLRPGVEDIESRMLATVSTQDQVLLRATLQRCRESLGAR